MHLVRVKVKFLLAVSPDAGGPSQNYGNASEDSMGVQFNIKNKVTINAVFKTTISVVIGTSSLVGAMIFWHRHEWAFVAASLAVSAFAWLRAFTRMPLMWMIFAWCGGTVEYEEPTPHGMRRMKLSNLPDSRVGVGIALVVAAVAVAALIPGAFHEAAATVARPSSRATPRASASPAQATHAMPPDQAVVRAYYTAVNRHHWLKAWRLWGNDPADPHGAAYNRMISGYRCTIHDQITAITSNRGITLVRIRAQESNGVVSIVQTYRYSYVVRDGHIKTGVELGHTGNPPPGCGLSR